MWQGKQVVGGGGQARKAPAGFRTRELVVTRGGTVAGNRTRDHAPASKKQSAGAKSPSRARIKLLALQRVVLYINARFWSDRVNGSAACSSPRARHKS